MRRLNQQLPGYPRALKQAARSSLEAAADWAVRNQIRDSWPAWDANKGRFPYHILIDPEKRAAVPQMWSTCWKTARAAQGLYSAWQVLGNPGYLAAANLAMDYVATLQVFEPGCEDFRGAFLENSPHGPHTATRDGMEAIQGFIAGYLATKRSRYLLRAVEGTDFLLRAMTFKEWPFANAWPLERRIKSENFFCLYAGALVFAQMHALTGDRRYRDQGLVPFADTIIRDYVRPDGSFGVAGCMSVSGLDHHTRGDGELAGVFVNDDGLGVALLAAHAVTGEARYRDAAVGWGDVWVKTAARSERLAVYPCLALMLSDIHRLTGDVRYFPVTEEFIRKTISQQYTNPAEPFLDGCFVGEDMATTYDKNSRPADYVDLRITSYALIALAKIAAETPEQWGCSYSAFGW